MGDQSCGRSFDNIAAFQKYYAQGMKSVGVSKDGETHLNTDDGVLRVDGKIESIEINNNKKLRENKVEEHQKKELDDIMECY